MIKGIRSRWLRASTCIGLAASRSPFLSTLYYVFFSRAFNREHHAVLTGQNLFKKSMRAPVETSSLLRRNVHRLEKGLISRPRRDVFALDYIEETVDVYALAVRTGTSLDGPEVCWARDVLAQYFDVTGSHPKLDNLESRFLALPAPAERLPADRFESRIPYARNLRAPPVSYESMLALAQQRRSVRWFKQEPVPRDLLLKALAIATQSPSACNRQPFEFRIIDDPVLLSDVAKLPAGTVGYEHNFPCVVVVLGRQRYYFHERDRHLIYIDGALAAMSFILALETISLSSCCINWPDIEERERRAARILRLEPDERPIMFIAVGFPDPAGLVPYSEKRTPEQLSRFNFE